MRSITASMCGCSASIARRQLPHVREHRVEQPHPAVAAEQRDRLGEIVERFALHPDQGVEAALEIEPLGHVVEQIGDAAIRIGRGDDAQRALVGQVPFVLGGLGGPVGLVELRPSRRGNPAARAAAAPRAGGRARRSRRGSGRGRPRRYPTAPDRRNCRRRDCGRRPKMATPVASWSRVRRWAATVRAISARSVSISVASRPMPALPRGTGTSNMSKMRARAGDDRRRCARKTRSPPARQRSISSRAASSRSSRPRATAPAAICRLDGARIGRIDEGEPPGGIARPHRRRQRLDQRALRFGRRPAVR